MHRIRGRAAALLAAVAILGIPAVPADATRIRPGTISFGFAGTAGILRGTSDLADLFNSGAGGEVRVAYRMRRGYSFGATFGEQFYNPRLDTLGNAQIITAGLELGRYFGDPEHPFYFLLGAGVWNPTVQDQGGVFFEKNKTDHIYGSATLGAEFFVRRTVAIDLSIRDGSTPTMSWVTPTRGTPPALPAAWTASCKSRRASISTCWTRLGISSCQWRPAPRPDRIPDPRSPAPDSPRLKEEP